MNKVELAHKLNGQERRSDFITKSLSDKAKEAGLIVVFGDSDDLLTFYGAIYDDAGMYGGGYCLIGQKKKGLGIISDEALKEINSLLDDNDLPPYLIPSVRIDAIWNEEYEAGQPSWIVRSEIPHERFMLLDDEEPWSEGIVISVDDVLQVLTHPTHDD